MPPERPTREQLIALAKSDPEKIADLVLALWDQVVELRERVSRLERDSRNSNKPPSSDRGGFGPPPPKPKSRRKKTGRRPGGQPGHAGDTLRQSDTPDRIEEHRLGAGKMVHGVPLAELLAGIGTPPDLELLSAWVADVRAADRVG